MSHYNIVCDICEYYVTLYYILYGIDDVIIEYLVVSITDNDSYYNVVLCYTFDSVIHFFHVLLDHGKSDTVDIVSYHVVSDTERLRMILI